MNIICTFSNDFRTGGIENYWIRIAKWANRNKITFKLFIEYYNGNIRHYWDDIFKDLGIEVCRYKLSMYKGVTFKNNTTIEKGTIIIVPNVISYVGFSYWKKTTNRADVKILLYSLFPNDVLASPHKKLFNVPYFSYIRRCLGDSIVFMDLDCLETAEEAYETFIDKKAIIPIGYEIEALDTDIVKDRHRNNLFNILSISRFDFPLKGYQIGLLDGISDLVEKYPTVQLTIIGSDEIGDGDTLFQKKLTELKPFVRERIRWIKRVDYLEIKKYVSNAHVYIGMGSTVLDAAKYGLPSIVMAHSTFRLEPIGFFHENAREIGKAAVKIKDRVSFDDLFNCVYNESDEEYIAMQIKTYEAYSREYNIDTVMERFLSSEIEVPNPKPYLSIYNCALFHLTRCYAKLKRKLLNKVS